RGDATLTWADVTVDDAATAPAATASKTDYAPFALSCGARDAEDRCDAAHHAGNNGFEPGNSRNLTMPGEPFGMAFSDDGTAIAITHQSTQETSLFATGLTVLAPTKTNDPNVATPAPTEASNPTNPSLQFVLEGVANGGNGIAAVPHDPDAFPACALSTDPTCASPPRPAFLQTSRYTAEVDLLRYYTDEGGAVSPQSAGTSSSVHRPFLIEEQAFPITVNSIGTDSRGIAIDPTKRIQCKTAVQPAGSGRTDADVAADLETCARLPAKVYIANRAPDTLLVGEVGETSVNGDGTFNADQLVLYGNLPISAGSSRLYLAPIVASDGKLALRLFVICFDASLIYVIDPETNNTENIIRVGDVGGVGPFALTFDPFTMEDVARRLPVPQDPRDPDLDLKRYRFAYLASFTQSFVQVIDLDGSRTDKSTFEQVVFNLGEPTPPKGTSN
ncbi:MAG TPA: hypothetical protein VF407_20450, partial [Polyangiaceae bacterium]